MLHFNSLGKLSIMTAIPILLIGCGGTARSTGKFAGSFALQLAPSAQQFVVVTKNGGVVTKTWTATVTPTQSYKGSAQISVQNPDPRVVTAVNLSSSTVDFSSSQNAQTLTFTASIDTSAWYNLTSRPADLRFTVTASSGLISSSSTVVVAPQYTG